MIEETRNKKLFPWRNKANELMSKKHKKFCATLDYIEYCLILTSAITGCISIYVIQLLLGFLGELRVVQ